MSTNVSYSEIYIADLPLNSTVVDATNPIQTYHSYLITNGTNAPFTTGAAIVLNQQNQPLAQAQLLYTPVKGNSEMKLSKAVDVQVKNEEEETQREKKIEGVYVKSDNKGKSRKVKGTAYDDDIVSELYWEVEVPAGGKLTLKYQYYVLE